MPTFIFFTLCVSTLYILTVPLEGILLSNNIFPIENLFKTIQKSIKMCINFIFYSSIVE